MLKCYKDLYICKWAKKNSHQTVHVYVGLEGERLALPFVHISIFKVFPASVYCLKIKIYKLKLSKSKEEMDREQGSSSWCGLWGSTLRWAHPRYAWWGCLSASLSASRDRRPSRHLEPKKGEGRRERSPVGIKIQAALELLEPAFSPAPWLPSRRLKPSPTSLTSAAAEQPSQNIISHVSVQERHTHTVAKKTLPSQTVLMKMEEMLLSFLIFHGFLIPLRLTEVQLLEGKSDRQVQSVPYDLEPLHVILVLSV